MLFKLSITVLLSSERIQKVYVAKKVKNILKIVTIRLIVHDEKNTLNSKFNNFIW